MDVWNRKNRRKPKCKGTGTPNKQKLHWLCRKLWKTFRQNHLMQNWTTRKNITTNHTSLCPNMRPWQWNSRAVLWRTRKGHRQESLQPPHSNGRLQRQNWSEEHKWQNELHRTLWNRQQKWERGKTAGFCWRKQPSSNKLTLLQSSKQKLDMGSSRRCDQKPNDFILSSDRKIVQNCEVITKVDIGSDHRMVRARVEIDKKTNETKKNLKTKTLPFRPQSIRKISHSLQNWTKNRFDTLTDEEPSIEKMNTVLRKAMDTIQNQTQKSTTEKSIEDTEIENLDKKRKELRQKTNKTLKDKVEYSELNKLVKKKRRTRARRKRKELILETLEARKGPRQINKHRNKQMILSMRKESGEITTNREEILKICANFYKSLYTQTVPTPESTMKSSPDTEEIPEFTEEEVERAIKRMKRHKAQGVDGITSDIIKLGGPMVLTYLTNIFNNILKTKQIPDSWHEAKIVILFKKGDPKDIKSYRPICLLSHSYKIFRRLLQTRIERTLDENQPREQAGFRKGYSATDHLQALNQMIEKLNEYNLPLCIGFIDYEKAFDTVEHFAIFEALRKTNVNETYINILQNIYNQATARVHLDKLVSTEFPIHRGVRQGDPLSPKLFTAVMEEVFKKAEISEGVNVNGENLSNLRFADDVVFLNGTTKQIEKHLNNLNSESLKVGLKIHKGKTKYMTNHADSEDILISKKLKKWQNSNTLDKPHTLKTPLKKKYMPESEQHGAVLEKIRKHSRINNSPFHLNK